MTLEDQVCEALELESKPVADVLGWLTSEGVALVALVEAQAVVLRMLEAESIRFADGLLTLGVERGVPLCHWCQHYHDGERHGAEGHYCPGPLLEPDPSWPKS